MPIDVTLTQTGLDPQKSIRAFLDSYKETSDISHYKKNQAVIEQYFKNSIDRNIDRHNIQDSALRDSFSTNFSGNSLQFVSQNNRAMKYEFGAGSEPPKRFMEPAVIETANKISDIIISDAIELYEQKTRFG